MSSTILIQPRISEKSFKQAQADNVYIFDVPMAANKLEVWQAVESQYKVAVEDVRTVIAKGKAKKTPVKRSQPLTGRRSNTKKAYVRLKTGNKISVFEEIE